jgi:hypothetical protein
MIRIWALAISFLIWPQFVHAQENVMIKICNNSPKNLRFAVSNMEWTRRDNNESHQVNGQGWYHVETNKCTRANVDIENGAYGTNGYYLYVEDLASNPVNLTFRVSRTGNIMDRDEIYWCVNSQGSASWPKYQPRSTAMTSQVKCPPDGRLVKGRYVEGRRFPLKLIDFTLTIE